jgi:integrase/recombinase XerD
MSASAKIDPQVLIEEFREYLRVQRSVALNTLTSYEADLRQFFDWLKVASAGFEPSRMSEARVRAFLDHLTAQDISLRSIQRKLTALRVLFRFLVTRGYLEASPIDKIKTPRLQVSLPQVFSVQEVESLLKAPDQSSTLGLRDAAMFEVMYSCGLRVSELLDLESAQVRWEEGTLVVKGKRAKERWVPLGKYAQECLKRYTEKSRPELMKGRYHEFLFVNNRGLRLTRQGFWKVLKAYAARLQFKKDLHPHILRHSFASHMLERGADLKSIQELMGHSDIATTQIYTQVNAQKLKSDYEKFHPRVQSEGV